MEISSFLHLKYFSGNIKYFQTSANTLVTEKMTIITGKNIVQTNKKIHLLSNLTLQIFFTYCIHLILSKLKKNHAKYAR